MKLYKYKYTLKFKMYKKLVECGAGNAKVDDPGIRTKPCIFFYLIVQPSITWKENKSYQPLVYSFFQSIAVDTDTSKVHERRRNFTGHSFLQSLFSH